MKILKISHAKRFGVYYNFAKTRVKLFPDFTRHHLKIGEHQQSYDWFTIISDRIYLLELREV